MVTWAIGAASADGQLLRRSCDSLFLGIELLLDLDADDLRSAPEIGAFDQLFYPVGVLSEVLRLGVHLMIDLHDNARSWHDEPPSLTVSLTVPPRPAQPGSFHGRGLAVPACPNLGCDEKMGLRRGTTGRWVDRWFWFVPPRHMLGDLLLGYRSASPCAKPCRQLG